MPAGISPVHPDLPRRVLRSRHAVTLIELVVVLVILVAMSGLLVPMLAGSARAGRATATKATLDRLRDVIVGSGGFERDLRYALDAAGRPVGRASGLPWPSPSDITGGRADHPQLRYLFLAPGGMPEFDGVALVGWRGPYAEVSSAGRYAVDAGRGFFRVYGEDDDPTPIDGWGNPVVLQFPDVAVPLTERLAASRLVSAGEDGVIDTPREVLYPPRAARRDDVVLFLKAQDPNP